MNPCEQLWVGAESRVRAGGIDRGSCGFVLGQCALQHAFL